MIAFGREPELSHTISYLRSATIRDGGLLISTVKGFTAWVREHENDKKDDLKLRENGKTTDGFFFSRVKGFFPELVCALS